jgi:DNA-binding transcriptional regulator YdaS (Cro superfamily)
MSQRYTKYSEAWLDGTLAKLYDGGMEQHPHIEKAIRLVGTAADLGRMVNVSRAMVSQWLYRIRPVAAERCPAIERATNGQVRCEDLRPDIDWAVLRNSDCSDEQSTSPMQEAA